MSKWLCEVCGYIYDESAGEGDVKPGTKFADLPEGWVCPVCGAGKEQFTEQK